MSQLCDFFVLFAIFVATDGELNAFLGAVYC
jgi:hypothetical protein